MRVLVATGIFPPQIGGPATYSKLLYDELPRRGIEVEIANFGDYIDRPRFVRHFLYFLELLRKAPRADLVYAMDPVSVGVPALLASQIRGKRLALKVVGDYAWEQGRQRWGVTDALDDFARRRTGYAWQVRLLKRVETFVAEGAHRVVTPSKYLKSILVDWGVDPRKISVVYNGFHMEPVRETPSALRRELGWDAPARQGEIARKDKVIVTVGRLVPWKGIGELIGLMPEILSAHPDARLVVIGDGPLEAELREKARSLGLSGGETGAPGFARPAVEFVGRLDQEKLFRYVKAADLFVLNTSYEGFSHQILETMALGTPVITTAVGGNVEVIRNGENGLLVAAGEGGALRDAILSLLADPLRAERLAKAARKDVAQFTDEAMLEAIARELASALGTHASS